MYIDIDIEIKLIHFPPHFHIVNLGIKGVHSFFIFAFNIDCGYMLEPPQYYGYSLKRF